MSNAEITVRYDGPVLADHQMDVADLAPALLGLSELCKIANKKFNGDKASVKVLINTDAEHQCFQFNLVLVQSIWDATKSLVGSGDVASAKDVIEWLGIVGGTAGTTAVGLFKLLQWLNGRKIESTSAVNADGGDYVKITVTGSNNNVIVAHPQALELLRDDAALANIKKVVQPLTKEGYDKLEFERDGTVSGNFSKDEAAKISALTPDDIEPPQLDQAQTITAWVTVYSPVYDPNAPNWRFKFGSNHEYMDITATDIAAKAIQRGGAMIDDAYYVRLEIRQEHKGGGKITNHFKIVEVLDFKASRLPYQRDIFRDKPE